MTRFRWGLASDVGRARSVNQDNALAIEGLFAVADGMGGHRGGEVASDVAVQALRDHAPLLTSDDLIGAIHVANDAILDQSNDDESLRGMGTTLCVLALVDTDGEARLAIANVGDSRVYLFAQGELEQMTDDHSLVAALVREGRITQQEAEEHPQRNILTRALGIDYMVSVDAWEVMPYVGDRWVLCSDGLFNEVTVDQMAAVLRRLEDPDEAARELVRLANEGGGRDNITVLIVDIVDDEGHAVISPNGDADVAAASLAAGAAGEQTEPDPDDVGPLTRARRRNGDSGLPRFTWRVALFLFSMLLVAAIAIGAVALWGGDGDDDEPPPDRVTTTIDADATTTSSTTSTPSSTSSTTVGPGSTTTTVVGG